MSDQPDPQSHERTSGVVWIPGQSNPAHFVPAPPKVRDNAERNKARIVAFLTLTSSGLALYDLVRLVLRP